LRIWEQAVLSNVLLVVREIGTEKIMTRSAQIGLAAALLLLGGATFAMAQNGPPLEDTQQRGGTRIFMASTATTLATTVAGYWDYYRTFSPGRGNDEESTR
jgi:hypothetical protein